MKREFSKKKQYLRAALAFMLVVALAAVPVQAIGLRPRETEPAPEPSDLVTPGSTLLDAVKAELAVWSDHLLFGEIDNQYNFNLMIIVIEPQSESEPLDYDAFSNDLFNMFDAEWFQYGRVFVDFVGPEGLRTQVNDFDMISGEWYSHDFYDSEADYSEFGLEEEVQISDVSIMVTGWEATYDPETDESYFQITFDFFNNSNEAMSPYWALDVYANQNDMPLDMYELPEGAAFFQDVNPGEGISDCVVAFYTADDSPVTIDFIRYLSDPEVGRTITISLYGE
ncbi:MAG TPA: DUF5067 domain-containing protein [Clostridiaceae bacterium]|nr:DUF5067 domain-containing protein [Clostridiaceae bacterium]